MARKKNQSQSEDCLSCYQRGNFKQEQARQKSGQQPQPAGGGGKEEMTRERYASHLREFEKSSQYSKSLIF